MRVLHVGYSASVGGAARAMQRIHLAIKTHGVESDILAAKPDTKLGSNKFVMSCYVRARAMFRNSINRGLNLFHTSKSPVLNSHALLPSNIVKQVNQSDADIVHLHWINGETLSIKDITRITKPIVWTLHDMWLICGSEHVANDERWKYGYQVPLTGRNIGFDLDRWTWNRKAKHWKRPIELVTPSLWLKELVAQSPLTSSWPATPIKNPIDTSFWRGPDRNQNNFSINKRVKKFLFGSLSNDAHHKGGDLFDGIFNHLKNEDSLSGEIEFMVIGGRKQDIKYIEGFKCTELGYIDSDVHLKEIYSEVDALIIPSRIDNLPNMGVEALACGLPIIGFDVCGLPDIIDHLKNGYLATPFSVPDLTNGILYIAGCSDDEYSRLSQNSRKKALCQFSENQVGEEYLKVYQRTLKGCQ